MGYQQILPNYAGMAQDAYDKGRQRSQQRGLESLSSQYFAQQGNPLLSEMAKASPDAAVQFQKVQNGDEDRQKAELGELAGYLLSVDEAQRPALWQTQIAPRVGKIIPGADKEPYGPHVADIAQWAVETYGRAKQGASGVQGTYIDAQGNRVAIMRDGSTQILGQNAPNNQIIAGEGGFFGVNKGNLQAAPVTIGQPQAAMPAEAPQAGAQDVMGTLMALGQTPGVTPTSALRSPAHNAEVGGKPNSQHLAGTAMDYAMPPAMQAQFIALVQKNPDLQAIAEGDHVHVQQRRGAPGAQLQPVAKPAEKGPAPTELERRVEMARKMGASEDQIRAMVVGGGQTGNAQTVKTSQATSAKLAQFNTVQRQIDRLEKAAQSIAGNKVFDGGPLDQFAIKYAPQGQELEQAGAAIMPVLTALTRVPGVGSQSDLEARLASLQLPSASMPPDVNKRAIESLRGYMADLKKAYESQGAPAKPAAAPASNGWSIKVKATP